QVRVPRTGIRRTVIHEIEGGIVRDPSPRAGAADLPHVGWPRRHTEVGAAIGSVERLELQSDQHVLVGTRVIRAPGDRTVARVEGGEPSTDAEFAAAVAD